MCGKEKAMPQDLYLSGLLDCVSLQVCLSSVSVVA